jgi:RHS repeat-associated protein
MQNGVDPRTGLYAISINLPEIQTNDLRGPGFGLGMSYSPLNELDSGYGLGWNPRLSQYTPGKGILALSTGETFKVTGSEGDQLVMKEKKLDSFHFFQIDDTHYRVEHKSGMVEILEVRGSSQNRVALPVEIHSPAGHKITLDYEPFSGSHQILKWIKDDSGQTLLSVKRESTSLEVLLQPFAGPEGGPLARFVMSLEGSNKRVKSITLPTDQASWRFHYTIKQGQYCIGTVETPAGSREEVLYQDLGHQFPTGSGHTPLPRVTAHRIYPGSNQPMVDVRYTYPEEKNFVGFGLSTPWTDDGLDNLYKYTGKYEYQCVETLWVADEPTDSVPNPEPKPVRTIERTFNQFHLLTSETTTQNNNVQTVKTTYHLTPGEPFEAQPKNFQLPKEVKTTWSLLDNATRQRSETVSSTYDTHGNLLKQTLANGVVETNTWYPAADANDFVRRLKDNTVTPAASATGNAPTLCTRYIYQTLPPLTGSPLAHWHTPLSETLVQLEATTETELQQTVYTYINQPGDAFLHGRGERQTVTLGKTSSFIDYQYEKIDSPQLKVPVLQTTETFSTSFDTASKAVTRQHSLLTSNELLSLADGVEVRYTYDALNRLTQEIVSPGTDYQAIREYEHTLSTANGKPVEHFITNAKKIKTRVVLDGLARAIFEERDHVDSANPSRTRQTSAALYNAWGDLAEQTEYDWLDGKELALTTRYKYDDWAQQCTVIGPDGVEEHQTTDPIGTDEWRGPIVRSWRQSAWPAPIKVGLSETWLNTFGKPVKTRILDAAEQEVSVETYAYDGLGRCTEQSDPYKQTTRFVYDVWSRMVSSTLPDGSIVQRTYAAHSTSELQVALRVSGDGANFTLVGEQEFDGLERLTRLTTGQRTERYAYDGGQMQISSKTTPANQTISYDYNLVLTGEPIALKAPDEIADFSYDWTSARLTQAKNGQGTREYDYGTDNQLLAERWVDKQQKVWQTLHSSSMQGRLLKRTDLQHETSDGLDTVHVYDDFGRVRSIDQGQLEAVFEYDNLGQLIKTTTTDRAAKSVLVTEVKYDDQGRETLRTQTLDQQTPRTQAQTWRLDGLLESRHLRQGRDILLKERFEYDFRGRLTTHECSGSTLPRDSEGREITKQVFTFDALDNITMALTYFPDESSERARFAYASDDPCLLKGITYNPPRATGNPTFTYDLNGNQLKDERGQQLSYDSRNRLLRVETAGGQVVNQYHYDSHDHLVNSQQGNQSETLRFYQGQQLNAVVQDDRQTRILYHMDQPLGQQQDGDAAQTLLLLTNANHSVVGESQQRDLRTAVYSAYGERHSDDALQSLLAFNGEVLDQACGWYLLGRGYRAYNPVLMRFHSPDSLSPFGSGGVNPYTYCLGNPIALRDPTGHSAIGWSGRLRRPDEDVTPASSGGSSNILGWVFVAIGAVGTAALAVATVFTAGATAPLAGKALAFTVAKAASLATATALSLGSTAASAVAAANGDEEAGNWGMYLGLAAIVPSVGAGAFGAMAKAASTSLPLSAAKAAKSLDSMMSHLGSGYLPTGKYNGALNRFRVVPRRIFNNRVPNAGIPEITITPPSPTPPAVPPVTITPPPAPAVIGAAGNQPTLNQIVTGGNNLRPTVAPGASQATGAPDQLREVMALRSRGLPINIAIGTTKLSQNTESELLQAMRPRQ